MINSFVEYQALLTKNIKKLSEAKRLGFARQVAQRLYDKHRKDLYDRGFQTEAELAADTLNLLTALIEGTAEKNSENLESRLTQLYKAGYLINWELDLSEINQLGPDQLINALQYAVAYLLEGKVKHLTGCAFCAFDVIALHLVKKGIDMADRDKQIDHHLFQEEFTFQMSLFAG